MILDLKWARGVSEENPERKREKTQRERENRKKIRERREREGEKFYPLNSKSRFGRRKVGDSETLFFSLPRFRVIITVERERVYRRSQQRREGKKMKKKERNKEKRESRIVGTVFAPSLRRRHRFFLNLLLEPSS